MPALKIAYVSIEIGRRMFPARKSIVLRRVSPPSLNGNQQMTIASTLLCAPCPDRRVQRNATAAGTRFIRLLLTFGALIAPCLGEINVAVVGTTNTQAVLTYTAPDSNPCQLQVSESSGLSPVVHDVDTALFSGSNSDSRSATVVTGTTLYLSWEGGLRSRAATGNGTRGRFRPTRPTTAA
jgi:hypothetical protein